MLQEDTLATLDFWVLNGGVWVYRGMLLHMWKLAEEFAEWCFLAFLACADVMLRDRKLIKLVNRHISQRQRVNQIINSARLPARRGSL